MSQETGEEVSGRFTALNVTAELIRIENVLQTALLSSINESLLSGAIIPSLNNSNTVINLSVVESQLTIINERINALNELTNGLLDLNADGLLELRELNKQTEKSVKELPNITNYTQKTANALGK